MKAIEINTKTDNQGTLKLEYKLNRKDSNVRVVILINEPEDIDSDDENLWLKSVSKNPAFEYLNDPEEDIYTLNDGEPIYTKK